MEKSIFSTRQRDLQKLLAEAREEANITQFDLAQRLNTGQSRISDYERGERRMDLVQLERYCHAIGIDLVDFIRRFVESDREVDQPNSTETK